MAPEREFRENSGTTGSSSRNCGFLGTAAMLSIAHGATQPPRPRAPPATPAHSDTRADAKPLYTQFSKNTPDLQKTHSDAQRLNHNFLRNSQNLAMRRCNCTNYVALPGPPVPAILSPVHPRRAQGRLCYGRSS